MTRPAFLLVFPGLLLIGCQGQPPTQARYTGGGGIGAYQDHPDTSHKSATDTGASAAAKNVGQVPGGGTQEPNNWNSPTESNGGTGGSPEAYPLVIAQGKTTNGQNNTPRR